MLVSSFLAAAALAQVVGNSVGYAQTGLLFVEPDTATLALVNTADGSITDVHRQPLTPGSDPIAELSAMASGAEALETRPDGLFIVGSGVDIAPIKPHLEAATALTVNAPEEPETALARGAALASANAPLFSSSTAALAYAQDPGTGAIDPYAVAPGFFDVAVDGASGEQALAYSAVSGRRRRCLHRTRGRARVCDRQLYRHHHRYSTGRRPPAAVLGGERGRGDFRGRGGGTGRRAGDQHAADGGRPARTGPQCGRPGEAGARRTGSPSSCRCSGSGSRSRRPCACSGARGSGGSGARGSGPRTCGTRAGSGRPGSRTGGSGSCTGCARAGTCSCCAGSRPDSNSDSHRSGARALGPRWISRRRRIPGWWRIPRRRGIPRRRRLPRRWPRRLRGRPRRVWWRRPRRLRPRIWYAWPGFLASDSKASSDVCPPLRRAMPLAHCGNLHTGV